MWQNSSALNITERLDLLAELGHYLRETPDDELRQVMRQSYLANRWFTEDNVCMALQSIAAAFLDRDALQRWVAGYAISPAPHPAKTIGLVMAGNLPLVGFHDWLCVFAAGQRARVKLSEKDRYLLPFLVRKMGGWAFESWEYTEFLDVSDPLSGFDAVIATGSNNTARYFEQYFGRYAHIVRRNRNSVAVLDGAETMADYYALGRDIFAYFGLGCRNVSKLYVPAGFDFNPLLEALHEYRDLIHHDKYKNNFDYNLTLYILNNVPYLNNGCLLLKADDSLQARISSIHYAYYADPEQLLADLDQRREAIQCVVSKTPVPGWATVPFGQSQQPGLSDYADGVDVMSFLTSL